MKQIAILSLASIMLAGCGGGALDGAASSTQLLSVAASGPLWSTTSVSNTCEAMNPVACPSLSVDKAGRYTAGTASGNLTAAELAQLDQDVRAVVQAINSPTGACEKVEASVPGSSTTLTIGLPDGSKHSILAAGMAVPAQCNPVGTASLAATLAKLEEKYFTYAKTN